MGGAQLAADAASLVGLLIGTARRFDTVAVQGVVTAVSGREGALEVAVAGEPVRVLGHPLETLHVGDGVFVRRVSGYEWAASLYERFGYRGDVDPADPLHFVPRVESTLQLVFPADTEGHIAYLSVDYPSYILGWTLIANEASSAVYDIKAGGEVVPGTCPLFTSIVAAAPPALGGTLYAQATVLAGWSPRLPRRAFLEFLCTTPGPQATLTLTLERL